MTVISVIVGSTREGRFSEKPAKWILQHLKKREGVDARLLDLRDFPMPFFDQAAGPAMPGRAPYTNEIVQKWTAAIGQSDSFVFVAPEYNSGSIPSGIARQLAS
jgi:NAD(P)H-dependent FMN reductase